MAVQAKQAEPSTWVVAAPGSDAVVPSSLVEQVDRAEIKLANSQIIERGEQAMMERLCKEAVAAFHHQGFGIWSWSLWPLFT